MKNSVLKRVMGFTLTCVMLLMSFSTVAFASTVGEPAVTFNCNFDGVDAGTNFGASSKLGWYSFNNTKLGTVATDSINGSYVNIHGGGYRSFNVSSDAAIESGKVYFGFSYKYDLPEGMTGTTNTGMYVLSKHNASSIGIENAGYTATETETAAQQKAKNAFYIANIGTNLAVRNVTTASGNAETITLNLRDGEWHEIGYVFDMDTKQLAGIVDGQMSEFYSFPATNIGTIGGIGIKTSESKYYGSFDNFVIKHIPANATNAVTANAVKDEEAKTIDITLDEAISSKTLEALTATDAVTMKLCGGTQEVAISSVEKVNGIIRVTYDGDLQQGREYLVDFPENLTTIYGTALPDGAFVNANGKAAETVDESQVIIPTHDFESDETLNTNWYNSGGKHVVAEIPADYKADNTSTYAMSAKGWSLKFGDNTTMAKENLKGVMTLEFDYYHTNKDGILMIFSQAASGGYRNAFPVCSTAWKHMKIEIDYGKNEIRSWVDNGAVRKDNADNRSLFPTSLAEANYQRLWIEGSNLTTSNFYIDNFSQKYEYTYTKTYPCVKSVRYIDTDGNVTGSDNVPANVSKIEITFSEAMNEDSLANIEVPSCVTAKSYDAETFIYTLTCGEGLTNDAQYEITIPDTVVSASGSKISETIYQFNTLAGEFTIDISLDTKSVEIADLAGKPITVNASISNPANTAGRITLIYALYDDYEMVDVGYATSAFPDGRDTVSADFTVKAGITPDSAKVFAWRGDITNLAPLTQSVAVPNAD